MRPEAASAREKEKGEKEKVEARAVELTEDERLVLNLLKENSPVDLNELKARTGLSNKKWDTAIKGLRKHNLAKVEKRDEGLFVELV
jgi:lysyl-tRNA synthetase class 2